MTTTTMRPTGRSVRTCNRVSTQKLSKSDVSWMEWCWEYVCGASSSAGLGNGSYRCAVMSSGRNASAYLHPICLQTWVLGWTIIISSSSSISIYTSSYSSFHPYFTYFLFPSLHLYFSFPSSHPLPISSLVFLPLSANTHSFRCPLYSTRNANHTVNQWK